jgi:ParB-like chromosome segregation protein Spo0J
MPETRMVRQAHHPERSRRIENRVSRIAIEKLAAHPDNPNRMSKGNFAKLVRNIERTGRYEPLVVRPCPATNCHSCESRNPDTGGKGKRDCFQIINGHHRLRALQELGYKAVDAIVWDIDDGDTDILLATLNRLGGSNVLQKKLALVERLNKRTKARDLAKLLPHTAGQIERFSQMSAGRLAPVTPAKPVTVNPRVFFLDNAQQAIVEEAMSLVRKGRSEKTRAARNAAALTQIALTFTEQHEPSIEHRASNIS